MYQVNEDICVNNRRKKNKEPSNKLRNKMFILTYLNIFCPDKAKLNNFNYEKRTYLSFGYFRLVIYQL